MRAALLFCLLLCSSAAGAEDFASLAGQLNAAHKAGDYAAMEADAEKLLALRPDYPQVEYLLAVARAHRGDEVGTLAALGRLADLGVYMDVAKSPHFTAFKGDPGFQALLARFAALLTPVTPAAPAFRLQEPDFIPEGIAYDPGSSDFFVASVHLRKIVRVHAGRESDFAGRDLSLWSVLGLRVDTAHGVLWAVTAALPQMQGYDAKLAGKSLLCRFDLKSGALRASYPVPADGGAHELNDLTLGPDSSVYAADSDGGVYVLAPGARTLRQLTPVAALESSQGLALSADGKLLYVSDYDRGLYAYEFASGKLLRLDTVDKVNVYGVDGLMLQGRDLLATQNATQPQRLVRLHLDGSGWSITGIEVLDSADPQAPEPTLFTLTGNTVYFIANAQWSRFDDKTQLPPKNQLLKPLVLKLTLPN